MSNKCVQCGMDQAPDSQGCIRCGAAANKASPRVQSRLLQLGITLVRIGLWIGVAFIEIGALLGACHGNLSLSIVFSIVMLALIGFNRCLKRNVKVAGFAATILIFVAFAAFSQTPAGKASNAAQKRREAQEAAQDRVLQAEQDKEERRRQKQETEEAAADRAAQAQKVAADKAELPPTPDQGTALPEVMLASVQAGRHLDPSDPLVLQFAKLLDEVQRKSGESRMGLVEAVGNTHDFMLKRGVNESYLSILTSLNADLLPNSHYKTAVVDALSAYAALRVSH